MAINSNIAYKDIKNGEYIYSYCHREGNYNGVGKILLKNYIDYNSVKNLIDNGHMEK